MNTTVEIYEITLKPHGVFRFTSAQDDLVYAGNTYTAITIERGERSNSADIERKTSIKISMPVEHPFAKLYALYPPLQDAECIIYQATLPLGSAEVTDPEPVFRGVLLTYGSEGRTASFEVTPRIHAANRQGPRGVYSSLCRHALYSQGCKVLLTSFQESVTLDVIRPEVREVEIFAPFNLPGGYYQGGILRVTPDSDPVLILRQKFSSSDPPFRTTLELARWTSELTTEPGTVTVAPGCDYSRQTCIDRFDNLDNFGGFDSLTAIDRSPFFDGWDR